MSFHGHRLVVHHLHSAASMRCEQTGADAGMAHLFFFFFFGATGMVPPWELVPYANCVLCVPMAQW